ncbi:hypothetical protein MUK42_36919 [Musa troglodytarum]|uniref:Uncharacterized protein n=1 Tax=Musa troglodytarum TaxID=320322 RepID=A0A9E7EBF5_9LILI|nr:hypothetical protein MUK42_36919 [Musa troglodytarum]
MMLHRQIRDCGAFYSDSLELPFFDLPLKSSGFMDPQIYFFQHAIEEQKNTQQYKLQDENPRDLHTHTHTREGRELLHHKQHTTIGN